MFRRRGCAFAAAMFMIAAHADSNFGWPWVIRAAPTNGFAIDPKTITPAPGAKLVAGIPIEFRVEVTYKITGAKRAMIMMIPVDDKDRDLSPNGRQLKRVVTTTSGEVALEQLLTVPSDVKQLVLEIPLMADDDAYSNTRGSIFVLYPVVKP